MVIVLNKTSQTIIKVANSLIHSEQKIRLLIEVLKKYLLINTAQSAVFSLYSNVEISDMANTSRDF